MPDDLADAIYEMDGDSREIALANWEGIGLPGQQLLIDYLAATRFRRARRGRCRLAAMQLMHPDVPLKVVRPTGGGGGGSS
jgi:hypothetical protein